MRYGPPDQHTVSETLLSGSISDNLSLPSRHQQFIAAASNPNMHMAKNAIEARTLFKLRNRYHNYMHCKRFVEISGSQCLVRPMRDVDNTPLYATRVLQNPILHERLIFATNFDVLV